MELKLTPDQQLAVELAETFFTKSEDTSMAITGSAGTGKTTLMQQLKEKGVKFAVAAPTHKAKIVISQKTDISSAYTLAELVGLGVDTDISDFNPNDLKFKPKNEPKIQNHKRFVIDEASMINEKLYNYLTETAEMYGTKILFLGDTCQLPPVKEVDDSLALTEPEVKFELTTVVRQANDNPLTYLLLALRADILHRVHGEVDDKTIEQFAESFSAFHDDGLLEKLEPGALFKGCLTYLEACTIEDKNTGDSIGWEMVRSADEFEAAINEAIKSTDIFKVIPYTNAKVSEYNKHIRTRKFGVTAPFVVGDTLMAYRTVRDRGSRSFSIINSEEYRILSAAPTDVSFSGKVFHAFRLFLLSEMGRRATVSALAPTSFESFNDLMAKAYWDAKRVRSKWKHWYEYQDALLPSIDHAEVYGNQALPYKSIDYGYAITAHKSQGSTYDHALVDGKNIAVAKYAAKDLSQADREIFMYKLLYVAISRAKKKATLYF